MEIWHEQMERGMGRCGGRAADLRLRKSREAVE